MKGTHYFALFAISCICMISCNSLTEPEQTINDPPDVTVSANNATIILGDTLSLTLHASDPTLKNNTIDFKDSNVITLSNLGTVFDTTLIHVFKSVGSFAVTAAFSDGKKSTTKQLLVTITPNPS